jgi:GNAT superfamily N-acetyltransferase
MASGLPHPRYNSGDVTAADADLEAARAFYGALGVRWGLRVPAGVPWHHGSHLGPLRLMGLAPARLLRSPPPPGLRIAPAGAPDLESVLTVDAAAFESDRGWIEALLGAPDHIVTVALAHRHGEPVATGYAVLTDSQAGPAAAVAGVAVLAAHRRVGIGAAVSSWLAVHGFDTGARLAHLSPDDDRAARLYGRLGFVETTGLDIYLDL